MPSSNPPIAANERATLNRLARHKNIAAADRAVLRSVAKKHKGSSIKRKNPAQSTSTRSLKVIKEDLSETTRALMRTSDNKAVKRLEEKISLLLDELRSAERVAKRRKNPARKAAGSRWQMMDGQIVTTEQLKRKFMGKLPTPAQRKMLLIRKVK